MFFVTKLETDRIIHLKRFLKLKKNDSCIYRHLGMLFIKNRVKIDIITINSINCFEKC